MPLARISHDGQIHEEEARYLTKHQGLEKIDVDEAEAGSIVVIAGLTDIAIGETLADPEHPVPLPSISVEEPTLRMEFAVNSSPFTGHEGEWSTSRKLRERLFNELRTNVSLRVEETDSADRFNVSGRGELHLAILIETMRREGYEFQVSRPQVILHHEDGKVLEPFEEIYIETTQEAPRHGGRDAGPPPGQDAGYAGRQWGLGELEIPSAHPRLAGVPLPFHDRHPRRGVSCTVSFTCYLPKAGGPLSHGAGSLVAWEAGTTTTYGLKGAEERGILFLGPGVEVYEGMVVGGASTPGEPAGERVQETTRHQSPRLVQRDRQPAHSSA